MRPSLNASEEGSRRGALWFRALVLGVMFLALALLAHRFVFPGHPNAMLWLPGGLSLAFLLMAPPREWPALLAAIFLAEFFSALLHHAGVPILAAILWSVGNCLRSLTGAWLMRHMVGTSIQLSRGWEIAGLVLCGGVLSPLPSATLGVLGATFWIESNSLASDWVSWWLSDGLGTLLVAPLLLTWRPAAFQRRFRHRAELTGLLVATALGAYFIFGYAGPEGIRATLAYASFPFVLWGALRLGPQGAASTSAVVEAFALWHTRLGHGSFGALNVPPQQKVLILQAFLATLGLTALTLAAVVAERRRTEDLQQLLVEAGTVLADSLNVHETFPRVARLMVPRACTGFALWQVGESGLLERVTQAGWSAAREARVRGHLPPLPDAVRRWSTAEGTVVLAPLRVRGRVRGALVFMNDERARFAGSMGLTLAEDLAHRCAMALESSRLYAEAREAVEARNEFIAIAAHELRTPLTALTLRIRSLDAQLQREQASETARGKVRAAARQLLQLSQLVERLLDVGRITTGRLELQREQVDVSELVEQVVDAFREEATKARTELRTDVEEGLRVWWDRGRVEQALTNLLANALKFGAGHPVEIHVTSEAPWVRIAIQDHGIGIAPEALERIFERFERAVSSRRYGGLGLGLFLARQIAESHSGTIHVESNPGEGATFVLRLPVAHLPEAEEEAPHPAPS